MPFQELASHIHTKHVVCLSGGKGSALAAIEVFHKYGSRDLVLLNHDIHPRSEAADIKRFKRDVAAYCCVPITYANMLGWDQKDQFDVVVEAGAFKAGGGNNVLCTNRMKTSPFVSWLKLNAHPKFSIIYYGFSLEEQARIVRRSSIMGAMGYRTDYPVALWKRTIEHLEDVGIHPPETYDTYKHANCTGCLKGGVQHWYVVYCTRPDVFKRASLAEEEIDHTILKEHWLADLEPIFQKLKELEFPATEHISSAAFWNTFRVVAGSNKNEEVSSIPCECTD